jgi:hypothetical protein
LKLEYNNIITDNDADRLVEDAYQTGLEVRSAHELLDPATLIMEPSTMLSQHLVDSKGISQQQDYYHAPLSNLSDCPKNVPFESRYQGQQGIDTSHQYLPLAASSALIEIGNHIGFDQSLDTSRHNLSFLKWDAGNSWDYGLTLGNTN